MMLDDETLMAYADGEAEHADEIRAALASRPALAARVAEMRALRKAVADAYAPIADEPAPAHLTALLAAPRAPAKRTPFIALGAFAAAAAFAIIALIVASRTGAPPVAPKPQSFVSIDGATKLTLIPPESVSPGRKGAVLVAPSGLPQARILSSNWLTRPGLREVEKHYPTRAAEKLIGGRVELNCTVNADGTLKCRVAKEDAAGWGFGQAALKIAHYYRLATKTSDGYPTIGATVSIPLDFAITRYQGSPNAPNVVVSRLTEPRITFPSGAASVVGVGPHGGAVTASPTIVGARWIKLPGARDFDRYYPPRAAERGMEGRVGLYCTVNAGGRINCGVVDESPIGWGFGEAALRLSKSFQMAPITTNGTPTANGAIYVPITFKLGGAPPPAVTFDAPPVREGGSTKLEIVSSIMPETPAPVKVTMPDDAMILRYYPPAALANGIEGSVKISCIGQPNERINCMIASENPKGWGFGAAGLQIFRDFGLYWLAAKQRTTPAGATIIPLEFRLPRGKAAPSPAYSSAARPGPTPFGQRREGP